MKTFIFIWIEGFVSYVTEKTCIVMKITDTFYGVDCEQVI